MQLYYLLKGLELAPALVQRIIALVPEASYDLQVDPDRFSLREAIAHLADWEAINLERLQRGVAEPGCTVQGLDEGQIAIERGYSGYVVTEQVARFAEGRAHLLGFLRSLAEEDWNKVFIHSERGDLTVYEMAVSILGHDTYHTEHFSQYLPEEPGS